MVRNRGMVLASVALASLAALSPAVAQERKPRIDVQHYSIEAEVDPRAQTLNATAQVRFVPLENTSTVSFELNNALNVSKVVDGAKAAKRLP